jgi:hypothetical protein
LIAVISWSNLVELTDSIESPLVFDGFERMFEVHPQINFCFNFSFKQIGPKIKKCKQKVENRIISNYPISHIGRHCQE